MKTPKPELLRPESLDCERAILGAILFDNKAFNQAASVLVSSDFSYDSNQKIYGRMCDLIAKERAIDFQTLTEELIQAKQLENIGGVAYLTGLVDGLPRVKNISQYVKIVREKSRSRMLLALADSIIGQIGDLESSDDVLQTVQEHLLQIVYHGQIGTACNLPDAVRAALNRLQEIRLMDGVCVGLSSGLQMFDELTTGFRDGEFYVIGARPGQGKTAWMCQSARANCKAKRKPSIFSIEVPRDQIIYRLACMETGLSIHDTRDPRQLTQVEMNLLSQAGAEIASWPLLIEDSPRITLKQWQSLARLHVSQGAEIIYVDFLQKLRHPAKSEYDRVTAIADGLWEFGRATGIPVVALSQLKRNGDEVPTLEDFRSSGQIEQNANMAGAIWRPKEVDPATQMSRYTEQDQIIILKQRSGVSETHVPVRFNGRVGIFEERYGQTNG